jgi:hypothetical protein
MARVARLTIVADPDQLLTEQGVLEGIRRQGFDLIPFDDHVAFRFAYESRYRQLWDRGDETTLVVVLRASSSDVESLPYDLLLEAQRQSRLLSFSIGELFPHLAPQVVSELDRSDLDALHEAQRVYNPEPLGENATRDFILRHVFEVAPELIKAPSDLLRVLLRRHYRGRTFPVSLDQRFIHLLEEDGRWGDWPLDLIVPDRAAFLAFLEERWPHFLKAHAAKAPGVAEGPPEPFGFKYTGPVDLPFDHDDVRVYIDNLFVEGHLAPSDAIPKQAVKGTWMALGVEGNVEEDAKARLLRLVELTREGLPGDYASHEAWVETAFRWAELMALRWGLPGGALADVLEGVENLHGQIEDRFSAWMLDHFASLHNLAYWPTPAMVHHIPRFLAHRFAPTGAGAAGHAPGKHALIVVDGLALDQWVVVRRGLERSLGVTFDEDGVFAWVPTLTGVSRQSIFSGDPPFYFSASLRSTAKEPSHWRRFWEDAGAVKVEVGYVRQRSQEPDAAYLERVRELAEHPKCRVLGVVVGTIDQTLHASVMGSGGLHANVKHWSDSGAPGKLVALLLEEGFEVFIAADHGNIESVGMGKPNVGAIADERGERAHVFRDDLTRAGVQQDYPTSIIWPQIGLPDDYRALLAPGRCAFIREGTRTLAHGGISLEEVIVPFARVRKPA